MDKDNSNLVPQSERTKDEQREIAKMDIQWRDIETVKPYERNAKKHPDDQVGHIANSLKRFGWKQPLVVDKDGVVVVGHGRLLAAKKLGLKSVPCVCADDLTEAEIKAFRLADNKTNESAWDDDLLDLELDELAELDDIDMSEFGFDLSDGWAEQIEVSDDNYDGTVPDEPRSKVGDLYQLGNHRLICGDSTDVAVIDRLMDGVKADMVFCDPPYGMKKESEGVLNDNLNFDDLLDFNRQWIPLTFGALKDNGSWYCWGIDEPLMDIYSNILKPMIKENKITFRNYITWFKGTGQGEKSEMFRSYPIASEKCLFVMMGVQGFSNNADNYFEAWEPIRIYLKQERDRMGWSNADMKKMCGHSPTSGCHWFDRSQWMMPTEEEYKTWQENAKGEGFKKEYEEIKKEYEEIKKEYYSTRAYFDNTHDTMTDVWIYESNPFGETRRQFLKEISEAGGHATPKPIALCSRAIKSSSREGEIVLDVFGGSGSTLIACEQLNRKCYMAELDERYVSVIVNRWLNLTGRKDEIFCIRDGQKLTYDEVFG